MHLREAKEEDLNTIYMMGYGAWGDDLSESDYLKECKSSVKYARGKWYILENDDGILMSSLLIHDLNKYNCNIKLQIRGIGSISTALEFRRLANASILVEKIIEYINRSMSIDIWFLYSDIDVNFYNKLNFEELPNKFQKYSSSILMAQTKSNIWDKNANIPNIQIPDYF